MIGRFTIRAQDGSLCNTFHGLGARVAVAHAPGTSYHVIAINDITGKSQHLGSYRSEGLANRTVAAIGWAAQHMPFKVFKMPEDENAG